MVLQKLRLALLVENGNLDFYTKELVGWIKQSEHINFIGLIIISTNDNPSQKTTWFSKTKQTIAAFIPNALASLIKKIERPLLSRMSCYNGHPDHYNVDNKEELHLITCPTLEQNEWHFNVNDIETIKHQQLDLILDLSSHKVTGDILHTSLFGIVKVFYEDQSIKRGGPIGFWECFKGWPTTGFVIKKLTDNSSDDDIIQHGRFPTQYYASLNYAFLKKKTHVHLKTFLSHFATERRFRRFEPSMPYSYKEYSAPTSFQYVQYILILARRIFFSRLQKVIRFQQRWNVMLIKSNWKRASLEQGSIIPNPKGRFFADPFIFVHEGRNYCFVEDYVYKTNRAHISVLSVDHETKDLGSIIIEPFHLSFPFIFRFNGQIYMCPESSEAKQIRLYKCVDFPLKWEFEKVIFDNISAVDSMFFEHNGLWWMLTNIDYSGASDNCSELYLYYAESPIEGEWKPHPMNPLVIDSEFARNAGIVIEGDRLFRIAQRQGFRQYGKSFSIREIITLNPEHYEERHVGQIHPEYKNKLIGTHHLSTTGLITAIDCLVKTFVR
jgi:hypothetical protein